LFRTLTAHNRARRLNHAAANNGVSQVRLSEQHSHFEAVLEAKLSGNAMLFPTATHWFWLVLALLAGVADGYWIWRRSLTRFDWFNIWAPLALAGGLVVAILNVLPRPAGLHVETFLLLSFGFIGCLLGAWLRDARSRVKLAPLEAAEDAGQAAAANAVEEVCRTGAVTTVEQAPGVTEGRKEVEIGAPGSLSQPAHIGQV
jgi:hypothetical protein